MSWPTPWPRTFSRPARWALSSTRRCLRCLGMVDDDRRRALLRHQLERLGQYDVDLLGRQDGEQLGVLIEIRAGRVAPRIALALLAAQPQSLPDHAVGVFRQSLGQRDAQAM